MATTTTTPYMSLILPIPGLELGPQWAIDIDQAFIVVDAHNHAPGFGQAVPSSGLNINADLPIFDNNLTDIRSTRFFIQAVPFTLPVDINCLYDIGGDLFFRDGSGNNIRMTIGGAVDTSASGNITGMGATTAAVVYTSVNATFTFTSNINTPANLSVGPISIGLNSTFPFNVTLEPSGSQSANYTLIFPPALPLAETELLGVDPSGNMSNVPTDDTSVFINGGVLKANIPAGIINAFASTTVPFGWLLCDGSAVSRGTFSTLFSAISTAYGQGNGTTTFNIPDLRGMFLRGVSGGSGNDPDAGSRAATNGGNSGNNIGSIQTSTFSSHSHTFTSSPHQHETNRTDINGAPFGHGGTVTGVSGGTLDTDPAVLTEAIGVSGTTDGAGGNETRPINIYVNFIIKT